VHVPVFNLRLCVLPTGDIYMFRIFSQQAALTFLQTELYEWVL